MTYSAADLLTFYGDDNPWVNPRTGRKNKHVYINKDKGIPVPGVTTILKVLAKPALIQWAATMASTYWREKALELGGSFSDAVREKVWEEAKNAHRTFSTAAADIGTEVHKYAEASLKSLPVPALTTDQARRGAEAFENWRTEHKIELGTSERICFSQEHWYAGMCDFLGRIDGENCVADFKTAAGIYPDMRFQLAAYQHAIEEETGKKLAARWIIRFDKKTGAFETARYTEHERDFEAFLCALKLHRTLQSIEAQDG